MSFNRQIFQETRPPPRPRLVKEATKQVGSADAGSNDTRCGEIVSTAHCGRAPRWRSIHISAALDGPVQLSGGRRDGLKADVNAAPALEALKSIRRSPTDVRMAMAGRFGRARGGPIVLAPLQVGGHNQIAAPATDEADNQKLAPPFGGPFATSGNHLHFAAT